MSTRERWQVSGNAPEIYEKYLVPAVFAPWAPVLIGLASPQPGERVLDLACGSGVVARSVAQHVGATGKVVGLDLNPGMLSVARSLPQPPAPPIEWREGDAGALPFPDESFDIVLCQLGLQYFTDRPKAVREMQRVLAPGGRIALLVWRPINYSPGFSALAGAVERHVGTEPGRVVRAPFSLGEISELRLLLVGGGFSNIAIRIGIGTVRFQSPEQFVSMYLAGSPLASQVARWNDKAYLALVEDVQRALQSYVDDEGLAFPIEGHLATGQTMRPRGHD